ncbi:DUF2461 domain-containing protein [Sphingobacterium psychroaquaticum]|uniref:DUF2461 domain-containing protein n=1 Tax=Sphingobacterium psychroaquaticum TaxID=561061 RepID=UPI00106B8C97|nr:DUF2461 domain-containing protein [Sphingobacterium psychroaquaticum]QBQ42922.1 DUF2461 domain-containing protein [Sphingobacterium psychroaquaticum]
MHIAKETMSFLRELRENNNREWFIANKDAYDKAQANVKDFITALIAELTTFDPHINNEIKASKCLFRIYRDIRFSKDKTPYKTWFAAGISVDGRKLDGPEYYLHIGPENNFIAAGYWRPEKQHLEAIRQEIDYNSGELVKVLAEGDFTIADLSVEDKLKRPPAGYTEDDPNIEVLKLKSFIIHRSLSDAEVTAPNALQNMVGITKRIYPFKQFIHQALDQ